MCNYRVALAALLFCFVLSACDDDNPPMAERYPGPWREDFHVGISRALAKNHIEGCGLARFRESSQNKNEFMVECSTGLADVYDAAYLVWVGTDTVQGPFTPDPSLR